MILFINTSQTNLIQLKLIEKNKVIKQLESREEFKQSELLLKMIDKLIKSIKSVKSIVVVSGPGAFSALRLGIATANTLAWALKIPIGELSVDEIQSEEKLISSINNKITPRRDPFGLELMAERSGQVRLKDWQTDDFKPVVPKYGKEPNITTLRSIV